VWGNLLVLAQCEPLMEYARAARVPRDAEASAQFLTQWRERFTAEISRDGLSASCRYQFRTTLHALCSQLVDHAAATDHARLLVQESQGVQQRLMATNLLIGSHVRHHGGGAGTGPTLPGPIQDECVSAASAALVGVPADAGLLGPEWTKSLDFVLVCRHVVATGVSGASSGALARLQALNQQLGEMEAHQAASTEAKRSLQTARCAVLRDIVDTTALEQSVEASRLYIEGLSDTAGCDRASLLQWLARRQEVSTADRDTIHAWIAQHGATNRDRAYSLYNRAAKVARRPEGVATADVEAAIADFAEASRLAVLAGEEETMQELRNYYAKDFAADAAYYEFDLLDRVIRNRVRIVQSGTSFLARFPEDRHASVVRSRMAE
jgi:hypothetical protein